MVDQRKPAEARSAKQAKYRALIEATKRKDEKHGYYLEKVQRLFDETDHYVIGQFGLRACIITGLLSTGPQKTTSKEQAKTLSKAELMGVCGHIFMEGNPGTAKTLTCELLGQLIDARKTGFPTFSRIQGRSDLVPAEILGFAKPDREGGSEVFQYGPVFSNIVLFDEINRARSTAQGALFEAMAEAQVTLDITYTENRQQKRTQPLPRPFYVIATQNPLDQEGTNVLPIAQLDRFTFQATSTGITTSQAVEVSQLNEKVYSERLVEPVITLDELLEIRQYIHDNIQELEITKQYAARLSKVLVPYNDLPKDERETDEDYLNAYKKIHSTKIRLAGKDYFIQEIVQDALYPRMTIVTADTAKTQAFLQGRNYVIPEDVAKEYKPASRHRVSLSNRAESLAQRRLITDSRRRIDKVFIIDSVLELVLNNMPIPFEKK